MATIIKFKRRPVSGGAGAPTGLASGEAAHNEASDIVYIGKGDDGSGNSTSVVAVGGKGAFVDLASDQTVAGKKTFSTSPEVPTAAAGDNTTKAASTAFVRATKLSELSAPNAAVSMGSQKLTNLGAPTAAQDAATKGYVDSTLEGLDPKASAVAIATSNITLSGTQTIDGVAVVAGNRVLVAGQTAAASNGIYVVAAGAWTRSTDANSSANVRPGMYIFVTGGTVNADTGWTLTTDGAITIGTTALNFTQFSSTGQIVNGTGLDKTGNTLSLTGQALALHNLATAGIIVRTAANTVAGRTLTGTAGRVAVTNGNGVSGNPVIDIDAAYKGQTSIDTLGTVTTGTIDGGSF